ncbi:MAG: hypothetical protein U5N86_01860 [Planctomycetota bacterium]|nr:hypothetical protein [Planctomycetota bacterium]
MFRKILIAAFAFTVALCFAFPAFGASQWDIDEDWDSGYYSGYNLSRYEPSTSGWYGYTSMSSSSSYQPEVTNYRYSSYSNSLHVGPEYHNYSSSNTTNWVIYKFPSTTPSDGEITFNYYADEGSLELQYSTNGYSWTDIKEYNTYYGWDTYGWEAGKETVPSGTRYIRWYSSSSYTYYQRGVWIDDVEFKVLEVDVSISGYNEDGYNFGTLNLTAQATSIYSNEVERVEWRYKKSTESSWTSLPSDSDPSDGFTTTLDLSGINDYAFTVAARGYDSANGGVLSDWIEVQFAVVDYNISLTPPSSDGGVQTLNLSINTSPLTLVHPKNNWELAGQPYYSSSTYENVNYANPTPMSGTVTKFETQIAAYIYGGTFKMVLYKQSGSGVNGITVAAQTGYYSYTTGTQTYTLSGSQWTNLPKGLYIGVTGPRSPFWNYNSGYLYEGNPQNTYYSSTYSSYWYSNDRVSVPLRVYITGDPEIPDNIAVSVRDGETGNVYPIASENFSEISSGVYDFVWDSRLVNSDEVYFDINLGFDGVFQGDTITKGPWPVYNTDTFSIDMDMSPAETGPFDIDDPGNATIYVLVDGVAKSPLPHTFESGYYEIYTVEAPRTIIDDDGVLWRFDYWSDGGARSHVIQVLPENANSIVAYYATQYYFDVVSSRPDYSAPAAGYYEPGLLMQMQVSDYSYVDSDERYRYTGYTVENNPGMSGSENWFSFDIDRRLVVELHWQLEYYFETTNHLDSGAGTADGWYDAGTQIDYGVPQTVDNGAQARLHNRGHEANGVYHSGTTYSEPLTEPLVLNWLWHQQYYVNVSVNADSTPMSGWYDAGIELTLNTMTPPTTAVQTFLFLGWNGTGPDSVTTGEGETGPYGLTVNAPIVESGTWEIRYYLELNAVNGSFVEDKTGWYAGGEEVTLSIEPPTSTAGSRYVPEWTGIGSGSFTSVAGPDVPTTVTITMNEPLVQQSQWHLQHMLTIENPMGYGIPEPPVGEYWFFAGDLAEGMSTFIDGEYLCSGFDGTGSAPFSSVNPYFSFAMMEPSTVSWNWTDRDDLVDQSWGDLEQLFAASPLTHAFCTDSNGYPVIAYLEGNSITIARYDGSSWNTFVLETISVLLDWLDVSCDDDGNVHVVYYSPETTSLYYVSDMTLHVAKSGKVTEDFTLPGDSGLNPHVAVNASGDVFVVFYDLGQNALKAAVWEYGGLDWQFELIDDVDNPGIHNALDIREIDGEPAVAYYSVTARALNYAVRSGGIWTSWVVDDEGDQGHEPALTHTPDGTPYISYLDVTDTNMFHLKFATRIEGMWYTTVVDDSDGVGYNSDILVDEEGIVHISYHDGDSVYYARFDGTLWEKVQVGGSGAHGNTLVLMDGNFPRLLFLSDGTLSTVSAKVPDTGGGGGGGDDDDGDTGGGGGGCFVATAAFGSLAADQVEAFTAMRDSVLSGSATGSSLAEPPTTHPHR